MIKLGPRGESLIKQVEKYSLIAYKPTPSDVWTIGWGSTRNVREGMVYNEGPAPLFKGNTIGDSLRRGDYLSAWAGFTLWRKQKNGEGKLVDLLGLARRRGAEMNLFLEDGLPVSASGKGDR